ncbi:hypothetical protein SARC_02857 [Sphaeroforma arctica JP610]|uniref:Uncharacterized protein n=1 Tax=Sphaeroforma arctica JP610 TaxID=667725 RepID=A0A0L0G7F4_9EUKA|nr:hypothetical protein SARC_02857 [Sphaeroforma arctica JP610]KNC84935.1 hypothetical protein SARC_02857 [Sphaeroforma arctica JP610]|eukprot:XP_014158837.1 hypothetical protein SARC_02857 [Sphaeroforma arctica JP610]
METAAEKAKEASTALEKGDYPEAIRLARESITTYTTVAARELLQRAETAQHTNTPGRPDTNNYNSANRDDAEKALTIARKRLAAGKPKDAIRFAKKSLGLCRYHERRRTPMYKHVYMNV